MALPCHHTVWQRATVLKIDDIPPVTKTEGASLQTQLLYLGVYGEHFPSYHISYQNKTYTSKKKKSNKACILTMIDYFRLLFKGLIVLYLQSTNFQLSLARSIPK